jgi:carboxylesterase type B
MTTTVSTPFGRFEGKRSNGVVQYLCIKYAKLKDQLSAPEMVESYNEAVVNATEYGCVSTNYSWLIDLLI